MMPLLYLRHQPECLEHLARIFKALKISVDELQKQHESVLTEFAQLRANSNADKLAEWNQSRNFPAVQSIEGIVSWRFVKQIGATQCYHAHVTSSTDGKIPVGASVAVKFARRYNTEAHKAAGDHAPTLIASSAIAGALSYGSLI